MPPRGTSTITIPILSHSVEMTSIGKSTIASNRLRSLFSPMAIDNEFLNCFEVLDNQSQ